MPKTRTGPRNQKPPKPVASTAPQADERRQRDQDAEQPGIALAVAPGSRIHLDVVVVVMVMRVLNVRLHVLSSLSNARLKSACLTKVPRLSSDGYRDARIDGAAASV